MRKNYCTDAPDTILGVYIGECCRKHDYHYAKHDLTRKEADRRLKKSIKRKFRASGKSYLAWIAWVYYFAVRLFGRSHYG